VDAEEAAAAADADAAWTADADAAQSDEETAADAAAAAAAAATAGAAEAAMDAEEAAAAADADAYAALLHAEAAMEAEEAAAVADADASRTADAAAVATAAAAAAAADLEAAEAAEVAMDAEEAAAATNGHTARTADAVVAAAAANLAEVETDSEEAAAAADADAYTSLLQAADADAAEAAKAGDSSENDSGGAGGMCDYSSSEDLSGEAGEAGDHASDSEYGEDDTEVIIDVMAEEEVAKVCLFDDYQRRYEDMNDKYAAEAPTETIPCSDIPGEILPVGVLPPLSSDGLWISTSGRRRNAFGAVYFDVRGEDEAANMNKKKRRPTGPCKGRDTFSFPRAIYTRVHGAPGPLMQVDHKDNCPQNNHWKNLQQLTALQNKRKASEAQVGHVSASVKVSTDRGATWTKLSNPAALVARYGVNRNDAIRACESDGRLGDLCVKYDLWGDLDGEVWSQLKLDGKPMAIEISNEGRHRDLDGKGGDAGPPYAPNSATVLPIGDHRCRLVDVVLELYGADARPEGAHAQLINGPSCAVTNLFWSLTSSRSTLFQVRTVCEVRRAGTVTRWLRIPSANKLASLLRCAVKSIKVSSKVHTVKDWEYRRCQPRCLASERWFVLSPQLHESSKGYLNPRRTSRLGGVVSR